jgi:endonuclease YncB( thermonuclease family)
MTRARGALALLLAGGALAACSSKEPVPKPDEIEHTAVLARVAAIDLKLEESERQRAALEERVRALERWKKEWGTPVPLEAQIAALGSKVADLEARNTALELKLSALVTPPKEDERRALIVDRRAVTVVPAPDETVKPLAVIDGETFSFAYRGSADVAALAGIEAPLRPRDYDSDPERRARAVAAWGEGAVSSEAAWLRGRERLEALLVEGDVSFRYDGPPEERRETSGRGRLLAYVHVQRSGESIILNDVLVSEGLALPHGSHERAGELERLSEEARHEKRGLFAGN